MAKLPDITAAHSAIYRQILHYAFSGHFARRLLPSLFERISMKLPWNTFAILALVLVALFLAGRSNRQPVNSSEIRVIALDPGDSSDFALLKGEPDTRSLRSALVTLAAGKAVGVYNTGVNEEMLVPLEGQGEVRLADHAPVLLKPGVITYAPAHTEHDVVNTGTGRLRYLVISAKAA